MNKSTKTIIEKIKTGQGLTDSEKMGYINYSMCDHAGKLQGIPSISTSCLCNPHCVARSQNPALICHKCYAMGYCDYRKALKEKLKINTIFYTKYSIPINSVPLINASYFRFESFGDLINTQQVENYFQIARKNSRHLNAALWTKNPWIIAQAIADGVKVPKNLKIIYSVPEIDKTIKKDDFQAIKSKYPFINACFSVHTPQHVQAEKITINCGGKSCRECGFSCYRKACRITLINELIK